MAEPITLAFILMAVIGITAIIFVIWLLATLIKLIVRGVVSVFQLTSAPEGLTRATYHCPRSSCRAVNPASARFCRRCGRELSRQSPW